MNKQLFTVTFAKIFNCCYFSSNLKKDLSL